MLPNLPIYAMSKSFDLMALLWKVDKSLLFMSRNQNSKGNIESPYSRLLGGITNCKALHKTDFSMSVNL